MYGVFFQDLTKNSKCILKATLNALEEAIDFSINHCQIPFGIDTFEDRSGYSLASIYKLNGES
jgi:hypothetical protein